MRIAICICTCNRPKQLDHLLEMLARMNTVGIDNNVFIQIADNSPDCRTRAVYELRSSSLHIGVHFVEEHERGISFARNRAILEALRHRADFVAFIDDDDLPKVDWLRSLVEVQQRTNSQLVFGLWEPPKIE